LPKKKEPYQGARFTHDSVLLLDKGEGLTSHDVVQQVKKKLGAAKVGHSGTLDPFATGVLILLLNGATKLSPFLMDLEKTYRFTVVFGVETDTQDSTGKVVGRSECEPLHANEIGGACKGFIGEIEQKVPLYSAVKVGGKRLHRLARQGVQITPPKRTVRIRSFSLRELRWPEASFEVTCSKGTYVRSLGVDLARHLDCRGHVSQLRRLRSGGFHLGQAATLEQLDDLIARGKLNQVLLSQIEALESYPKLSVSQVTANRIRQGATLDLTEVLGSDRGRDLPAGPYKVVDSESSLVAMVAKQKDVLNDQREGEIRFKTLRVFGRI
jgi:tRNA pseudouridine55 synthase